MEKNIGERFWWTKMREQIRDFLEVVTYAKEQKGNLQNMDH